MKLAHPLIDKPIAFNEESIPLLAVESPVVFRRMTYDLIHQSEGADGAWILSHDQELIECSGSLHVISDYAHLDNIDKKVQTKLLTALLRSVQETLAEETLNFTMVLQEYLGKLALAADEPYDYDRSENLSALLKAMNFHVDLTDLSPCEALYEQLAMMQRCLKHPCFVLIHAHDNFSTEEMRQLSSMAQYRKMNLLLLESHLPEEVLAIEKVHVLDRDLCEISLDNLQDIL